MDNFVENYGSWAIVTGASDGIGLSTAYLLAKSKFNLFLVSRGQTKLDEVREDLVEKFKVEVEIIALDLTQLGAVEKLTSLTKQLDVGLLVLAAGFGSIGEFVNLSKENELNMIELNCSAVVDITHHYAKIFKEKRKGGIILFGSLVGFQGAPFSATYSATKSFIQSFGESLHFELRPYGVDVLVTAPGPVNTKFANRAKMAMGKTATADDVAKETLKQLGKSMTTRPGLLSKFLGWSLSMLPRSFRVLIMKCIMTGMMEHKNA